MSTALSHRASLQDLSALAPAARRPRHAPWFLRVLPSALYLAFLAYMFIGVMPMSDASAITSGDGNATERLAVLGMTGIALVEIVRRRRVVLPLLMRSWPVWLVLGWFCASVSWAAFPDIAVRRVSVMVFLCLIALAIAAGIGPLRRTLGLMAGILVVVIAGDLAVTALNPAFAFTEIGVRGYHQQKNVAGLVAMLAVIVGIGWTCAAPRPGRVFAGLAFTVAAFAFLVLTKSKTSMMLALLGAALLPGMLLLRRMGPAAALALTLMGAGAVAVTYLGVTAFGGDFVGLLTPGNDASFTGRTQIWDFAASEIARRPWTGYGFGSFWDVGDANDPLLRAPPGSWLATLKIGERADVVINEAHNGYLDLRLQGGAPAVAFAVLAQLLTIFALAVKLFSRRTPRPDAVAAATFLVIALVVLVHNATESSLWMRGQVLANVSILISLLAFRREPTREPT
ncbi:O-antigen ligase family protein [Methylobacterium sp. J-076]|uniref:O-antigen ligase family protein n=1 Tax=Methylobacterium sp. J-076 TaxID=2836655 RepID=UPI001FBAD7FC|nr:O-antigen ligase family protein [Methylobacterium sp. J-076]MCJ2013388.1 O-antigen ligase family protein [Methylobacterium sp. J-076]